MESRHRDAFKEAGERRRTLLKTALARPFPFRVLSKKISVELLYSSLKCLVSSLILRLACFAYLLFGR